MMSDTRVHCLSIKLSRYLSINTTQTTKPLLKDKVLLVCLPDMNDIHNLPNIHIFCQLVVGLKEKASHLSQIFFTGTALISMTTFQKQIKSFVGLCYNLGNKVYTSQAGVHYTSNYITLCEYNTHSCSGVCKGTSKAGVHYNYETLCE